MQETSNNALTFLYNLARQRFTAVGVVPCAYPRDL